MKPEVVVNFTELQSANKKHFKAYERDPEVPSFQLLLFYAVETGLKSKFLKDHKMRDTREFERRLAHKYGYGHDIPRWVSALKIPAYEITDYKDDPANPIENLHEKLRYGKVIDNQVGRNQINYLRSIASYLKKVL